MSTETKKLLIFDMDGVVLDSEPLHENARQRMFRELGITPDDRLPAPVGKSASGFWRNVLEICGMDGDPYGLERRQYALVDMAFNLGIGGLLKFKKMLSWLGVGNYTQAATECLASKYAKDTSERAVRIARLIEKGVWKL